METDGTAKVATRSQLRLPSELRKEDKKMTKREITSAAHKLRKLNELKKGLEQQIADLEGAIKSEMEATGTYEMTGTDFKITWHEVTSTRFDSVAFKKADPESYTKYQKTTTTRRFLIA